MKEQIFDFIQNHWMLALAGAVVLVLLILEETKSKVSGALKVSAQTAILMLNRENTVVIDLRNQKAFDDGHILNSMNIIPADIDSKLKKLEAHKDKTIILIDDNEAKIGPVSSKLKAQGFSKIHVLSGGISAWRNAQLPLNKS